MYKIVELGLSKYVEDRIIKDIEYLEILFQYTLEHKPNLVLETGTYRGRSAIVIGKAMKINNKGKIVTIDNNMWIEGSTKVALEAFKELGLDNVEYVECNCLKPPKKIKDKKYDFIFLDSWHSYEHVKKELEVYSKLTDKIFIHDVRIKGVKRAILEFMESSNWKAIDFKTLCDIWLIEKEETKFNIPIENLVVYPFWNGELHKEIDALTWYNREYKDMDFKVLEDDIKINGIKEPLLVEYLYDSKYGVVDGNHRFYIALKLGIKTIPCRIISPMEKEETIIRQQSCKKDILKDIFKRFDFQYIKYDGLLIDDRILKIGTHYDISGKRILELGAFEGRDTYNLEKMNPKEIISIEGRLGNYMKCNVVKHVFKLNRTTFLYRDIESTDLTSLGHFDLCLARGILHHLNNPVKVIKEIARITDNLWLGIRLSSDSFTVGKEVNCDGYMGRMFVEPKDNIFLGLHGYGVLLYRRSLIRLLQDVGYNNVTIMEEPRPHNENNNYFIIYANRDKEKEEREKYWKLKYPC